MDYKYVMIKPILLTNILNLYSNLKEILLQKKTYHLLRFIIRNNYYLMKFGCSFCHGIKRYRLKSHLKLK